MEYARIQAIHLDPVGGLAGDMFAAAMLDALPDVWTVCEKAIAALQPPEHVTARTVQHSDGVLTGLQFKVDGAIVHHHDHGHSDNHRDAGAHTDHHSWQHIRARLEAAELPSSARSAAIGIFERLARAEGAVHGIAPDDVTFHEVGAWDSIIDIVVAAVIIANLPDCKWSVASLPRGSGLVRSAHGMLPVPAPATVELLKGFNVHDDAEDGERVTPTGAAILNYLEPSQLADPMPRKLITSGTGFGTKRLKQRSNILRATVFGSAFSSKTLHDDVVDVLRFEIDDQTAEDLAIALDNIRRNAAVLDVCQWPVLAKKGRVATAVQVLARPDSGSDVVREIVDETTTLGVRRSTVTRNIVERTEEQVGGIGVKLARRPGGVTAKAEATDVAAIESHAERQKARSRAEETALSNQDEYDGR